MAQEILISINVESGEAKARVNDLKKGTDSLSKSFGVLAKQSNKNKFEQASLRGEQKLATAQQKKLNYEMQNAGKIAAVYEMSTKKAGAGTKQFRTQVGLNNAILQEAGRAASDLRFGFNGVANNVGQLASLFGSLINTSDNVVTSLKNLGKSLLGTGGILIAVQLLIAYGDQIYNFFTGVSESAAKAEKSLKRITETVQGQRRELLGYIEVLKTAGIEEEVRYNALKELEKVVPELTKNNNDQKISLEQLTLEVEEYIEQQRLRAELDAIISDNQEVFAERERILRVQRQLDLAKEKGDYKELRKIYLDNTSFFDQFDSGGGGIIGKFFDKEADFAESFKKLTEGTLEEYSNVVERIIEIESKLTATPEKEKNKGSGKGRANEKVFKEGLLQLEKLEQSYRQKAIDQDLLTEEEKIENQRQADLKGLQITVDNFQARELIRLNAYIKEINGRKLTDAKKQELIDKANLAFGESIQKSEKDAADVVVQINANTNTKLDRLQRKRTENIKSQYDEQVEAARSLSNEKQRLALLELTDPNSLTFAREQLDLTIKQTDAEKERIAGLIVAADQNILSIAIKLNSEDLGEEERSRLEVGFADALTNRAKLDSEYTKVSIKNSTDRRKIAQAEENAQVQGFKVVGDAMNAFSRLAGEDTKAGKALAVSGALISTYLSANKAFESQFSPIATASSPVRGTIAAAAAVANGLANVKAILAVDPSGTTSGGSSPSVQAPNFNVVGASPTNQLAQAIGDDNGKPLFPDGLPPFKTYVVGKDMTNQQEFDRNTIDTAQIG